ncbi:MAG: penicillin-binding protein 1B MrcB [Idiomarinaceae bacterium HL-53]|nr:MAG: penicillin-binding protein 1B MrcB [Idiomarinaceae bacterium HL-53]CUS48248.1 penicillin-binding protein 1B [Idiomarinaceae bacterium HL-53]
MSFKSIFVLGLKLSVIGAVLLAFYSIYLDSKVTERFAYARYQAPALIYSRALELTPENGLHVSRIVNELEALDYRESRYAREPGEFQRASGQLLIHRRAFDFPDTIEPAQRLRLILNEDGVLAALETWPEQEPLERFRLEPQLMGRFSTQQGEDRLIIGLEEVPALMKDTLLLVEDQAFYHHAGVRPTAIVRAALANLAAGRTVQGGSTITQQLVKNMFLSAEQSYIRKFNEALMALILDFRFSKDEILEAYFNEVFFGQDGGSAIHGVSLGSHFYFGKTPQNLNVDEIALLIGMIKGPSLYNPRRNPEQAQERRDLVLRLMYEADLINQTQYVAAIDRPVRTREQSRLTRYGRPDYIDAVQEELRTHVRPDDWQSEGLKVYTRFSPEQQSFLEEAARNSSSASQLGNAERALMVVEHATGAVVALIGGKEPVNAGFNRAITAQRAIGSLVKPWVYAIGLEEPARFTLTTPIADVPIELTDERGQVWMPQNFDETFKGSVPLLQAFVESRNIPVINVGMEITPQLIRRRLVEVGVRPTIHSYPSLMLGTVELSPLEVSQLYLPLVNGGQQRSLHTITAITTHRGDNLYLWQPTETQVLSEEAALLVKFAMQQVVQRGTARALAANFPELGGKTGSTNELRDSWFVAFDAKHLITAWVGFDDNSPLGLTGSTGALPLVQDYWQRAPRVSSAIELPATMHWQYLNANTWQGSAEACESAFAVPAMGTTPEAYYDCEGRLRREDEPAEKRSWFERIFGGD